MKDHDIIERIKRLKEKTNTVLLAHYYQDSEIQDVADFIGDSLELSKQAAKTNADRILFAGVHFMAETAKILNPKKDVLLPDLNAGCSLADSCPPEKFSLFKQKHPNSIVISYINCSAEIKALSDIICTSSNAEKIIRSLPIEQEIIFAPDKNLGAYLAKKTNRSLILWPGSCMVHEIFSHKKLWSLKKENPEALVLAHPECEAHILELADFIGSTSALLKYSIESNRKTFIVVTKAEILHQMKKASPEKIFIPAPPENTCACNECPHMKLNTLEKIELTLITGEPKILLNDRLRMAALAPLQKMLDLS